MRARWHYTGLTWHITRHMTWQCVQDPDGFIDNGGWNFLDAEGDGSDEDGDDEEEEGEPSSTAACLYNLDSPFSVIFGATKGLAP